MESKALCFRSMNQFIPGLYQNPKPMQAVTTYCLFPLKRWEIAMSSPSPKNVHTKRTGEEKKRKKRGGEEWRNKKGITNDHTFFRALTIFFSLPFWAVLFFTLFLFLHWKERERERVPLTTTRRSVTRSRSVRACVCVCMSGTPSLRAGLRTSEWVGIRTWRHGDDSGGGAGGDKKIKWKEKQSFWQAPPTISIHIGLTTWLFLGIWHGNSWSKYQADYCSIRLILFDWTRSFEPRTHMVAFPL